MGQTAKEEPSADTVASASAPSSSSTSLPAGEPASASVDASSRSQDEKTAEDASKDAEAEKEPQSVRNLEIGEILELLQGPLQSVKNEMWIQARAEEDGAVGWVPIRNAQGHIIQVMP